MKNPSQRYTMVQIKEHPWMQRGPRAHTDILKSHIVDSSFDKGIDCDLNAQVISLMQGLKIDVEKTRKVKVCFV